VAAARERGRARSTTVKPSARRRRMETESGSCQVSHSSMTSSYDSSQPPILPITDRSCPKFPERCHPLTCPRISNLVRIGYVLPDLFRKYRFFGPESQYRLSAYNDTKHRVASLRQLSFLSSTRCIALSTLSALPMSPMILNVTNNSDSDSNSCQGLK